LSRKGLRLEELGLRWLGPGRRSVLSLRRCWLGACRRLGLLLVRGRARGCRRPGGGRAVLIRSSPDSVGAVLGTTAASTPAAADGPPGPLQIDDVAGAGDLLYEGLQLLAPGDDLIEVEAPVLLVLEGHDPAVLMHLGRLQE